MSKPGQRAEDAAPFAAALDVPAGPSPAATLIADLYHRHATELRRYIATRFGAGPPEPEEVTQAAFAKLAAAPDPGRFLDPRKYLFSIACNLVFDHHRRAAHRDAVHRDLAHADSLSDLSPERVLLGRERLAVFEEALQRMPPLRRKIFLLVRVEGVPPSALAQRFGISESAVHKHVTRALADCSDYFDRMDRAGGRP